MRFLNQLVMGFVVVLAIMFGVAIVGFLVIEKVTGTDNLLLEGHERVVGGQKMVLLLDELERAERDFYITGDSTFLEGLKLGALHLNSKVKVLKELVLERPEQLERLDVITNLVGEWSEERRDSMEALRREMGIEGQAANSVYSLIDRIRGDAWANARAEMLQFIEVERGVLEGIAKDSELIDSVGTWVMLFGLFLGITVSVFSVIHIKRSLDEQVGGDPVEVAAITERIAQGELDFGLGRALHASTGILGSLRTMVDRLNKNQEQGDAQNWLKSGMAKLNDRMRGELDPETLSIEVVSEVTTHVGAHIGALYLVEEEKRGGESCLKWAAGYAYKKRRDMDDRVAFGEGFVGQAAREKKQILIRDVPKDYVTASYALGDIVPKNIAVTPILFEGKIRGVLEVGHLREITELHLEFLEQVIPAIAINFQAAENRRRMNQALERSRAIGRELQVHQGELELANANLEKQARALTNSKEELKKRGEQLRLANEELEQKQEILKKQKDDLEEAKRDLEIQADELAMASQYKSEFLANMSHELRTPLNSLLILSKGLMQNKKGNLDEGQVEDAKVIHEGGYDLLNLINDIMDLSKVEAGMLSVELESVHLKSTLATLQRLFNPIADSKGVAFKQFLDPRLDENILTDGHRLEQILKNFLSNAFKFTDDGVVTLSIHLPEDDTVFQNVDLSAENSIAFSIIDTGIGIPEEKQKAIFEAFQQQDGSTSRKYGGTGLGLTISRELSRLLGGEVQVSSVQGEGSTFTVYLPLKFAEGLEAGTHVEVAVAHHGKEPPIVSERASIASRKESVPSIIQVSEALTDSADVESGVQSGNTEGDFSDEDIKKLREDGKFDGVSVLLVDDDMRNTYALSKQLQDFGLVVTMAENGEVALNKLSESQFDFVLMDIMMPVMDGYTAMKAIREIESCAEMPIIALTVKAMVEERERCLAAGASDYMAKPLDIANLLLLLKGWLGSVTDSSG